MDYQRYKAYRVIEISEQVDSRTWCANYSNFHQLPRMWALEASAQDNGATNMCKLRIDVTLVHLTRSAVRQCNATECPS